MRYFCIIWNATITPEYTFHSYDNTENSWSDVIAGLGNALDKTKDLKLHSNANLYESEVDLIVGFIEDDPTKENRAYKDENVYDTDDLIKWFRCKTCLENAEEKGVSFPLKCKH